MPTLSTTRQHRSATLLPRVPGGLAVLLVASSVAAPGAADAQLLSQSELDVEDSDPAFELTLEHLAMDSRWMGLPPRSVTWSPDGERLYFRWREAPDPDQDRATDPWYVVDRAGTEVRVLSDEEVARIPTSTVWSDDRSRAAWVRDGVLHVWDATRGVRTPYRADGGIRDLALSADGSVATFSTRHDRGELWSLDLEAGELRQVARVVTEEEEDTTDTERWLVEQQLELVETLAERKREREVADSVERARSLDPVQRIPVARSAEIRDLQLSPDGRYVTFEWRKEPGDEEPTRYMDFVTESGHATPREARAKVGYPQNRYRLGIVRVDPGVHPDSVEVIWADDGLGTDDAKAEDGAREDDEEAGDEGGGEAGATDSDERRTRIHGPWFSPDHRGREGARRRAVVQVDTDDYKERWISLLDLETGETTRLHHIRDDAWLAGPLTNGRMSPGFLEWLPDGSAFAFSSMESGWEHLYLANPETGEVRPLTSGEWEVRDAELSPRGTHWLLTTSRAHPGEEHLYSLPLRGGEMERITWGEGIHRATVSPDGRRIATLYETSRLMPDLYLLDDPVAPDRDTAEQAPIRITKSGTDDFYRLDLLDSEIVTFRDQAGEPTWAEIWERPEGFNGAAVVYVHGCGECGQGVTKGWRRTGAKLYAKYMAQRGYRTANLDYRGSFGYGHANRTYAYRQMGVSDIDSGLALLDLLEEEYDVEPGRIGVYGGSYGGFYTLMALFRHPDRFAAGVALYPVADWAHYNHSYTARILNGAPVDDPEAYRVSSPIYYADGYDGGLQIQHGLVDGNVQIQDVFRLTQVLLEMHKPFDLAVYPMEGHGWRTEPSRRDSYRRMTEWFDRHLLGTEGMAEEGAGEDGGGSGGR